MSKKGKVRVSKQAFVNSTARAWPKYPSFEESIRKDLNDKNRKNGLPDEETTES